MGLPIVYGLEPAFDEGTERLRTLAQHLAAHRDHILDEAGGRGARNSTRAPSSRACVTKGSQV